MRVVPRAAATLVACQERDASHLLDAVRGRDRDAHVSVLGLAREQGDTDVGMADLTHRDSEVAEICRGVVEVHLIRDEFAKQ